MKVIETRLPGLLVVEPRVFADARGSFHECFHAEKYAKAGIRASFVQSNVSHSSKGVLRGLHYQHPVFQAKLVTVLAGEAFDVAVDIRRGSPTFGQWFGLMLTAQNNRQLWIPEGFAHGFCALSDQVTFTYQCTALYDAAGDTCIRWDDPDIAIDWPISAPLLSTKDSGAQRLREIAEDRLPAYPQ